MCKNIKNINSFIADRTIYFFIVKTEFPISKVKQVWINYPDDLIKNPSSFGWVGGGCCRKDKAIIFTQKF